MKFEELTHNNILTGEEKEDIRKIHIILNHIEDQIDTLKENFMLEGKDEFGNEIDYACYQMEIKTLYKRQEMCIDYMKSLYTPELMNEIRSFRTTDEMYRQLGNIYAKWLLGVEK